jgi:hypothetical protein
MVRRLCAGLALALVLLGAALAAGCGGGGPRDPEPDEQEAIEARLDDYTQGFADGDPKAICATFVPDTLNSLGGESACVKAYASVTKNAEAREAFSSVDIDRIEIADDGSIARLYPVGAETPIRFQPVGEDWYVVPPAVLPGGETTTTTDGATG